MPSRNLGERKSFEVDDGVGFDGQGYLLTAGDDGPGYVKKATATDSVLGVNYTSTFDETDDEILQGWRVPVIHDGYPNVLAEPGEYTEGQAVFATDDATVTDEGSAVADATKVGNVISYADHSDETEATLIQVDITSNTGDS